MALFDELRAKVQANKDASDAMQVVLHEVKTKLDEAIANAGSLSPEDAAALQEISDSIQTETDDIVADTLANTPAAPVP